MKPLLICALFASAFAVAQQDKSNPLTFLTKAEREQAATLTLEGIEALDAIVISTRDRTRQVDWQTFRKNIHLQMTEAHNWDQFNRAIDDLHSGITNLHSSVLSGARTRGKAAPHKRWPALELGYTWPQRSFFDLKNDQDLKSVNGQPISALFADYYNWHCRDLHESACANSFVRELKEGYPYGTETSDLSVTYATGQETRYTKASDWQYNSDPRVECNSLYTALSPTVVFESEQSCLLTVDNAYVLKIKFFGNWGADYFDIHCHHAEETGMCADIRAIAQITRLNTKAHLIVDLQHNPGGSENTPWVAALTHNGFLDSQIEYRNLSQLQHKAFREAVFYEVDAAERWYQSLAEALTTPAFLPKRADFCRGDDHCAAKRISSRATPLYFETMSVITGPNCVSSCDDLVWRLRDYAGATVYGQLNATDSAYARAMGYVYLDKARKVKRQLVGEMQQPTLTEEDHLLLQFRVPISRTVNAKGELMAANTDSLDHPLRITKRNYRKLAEDNLRRVLSVTSKAHATMAAD